MFRSISPETSVDNLRSLIVQLKDYYHRLACLAARERDSIAQLGSQVGQRLLHLVPQLSSEVNSLDDLLTVCRYLLSLPFPAASTA